jgi:hypothetical protein
MTPFEQFRLWLRRAPTSERMTSAIIGAVVVSLVVFILLPVTVNQGGESGEGGVIAGGGASGAAGQQEATPITTAAENGPGSSSSVGAASGGPTESAGTTGTTGGGGVAASGGSAPAGCASPPGSDQGISSNEIHIAVVVLNVVGPSGNAAFGVPSADEQQQDYELAIDDVNKHGGVACRKLVAKFYTVNPADEDNQKATCLDIVGSKVFALLDAGGYYGTAAANCFPQQQMPFFGTGRLAPEQIDKFYPYMFGTGDYYSLYRNGVLAFNETGFFTKDPTFKLGWMYRDCWASLVTEVRDLLHQVGLKDSQIVGYDVGCPVGGFASPADLQQAILKFQSEGVTHVIESQAYDDFANFTNIAQGQGFKPKYGMLDQEMIPITQGNVHVNYDNVEGALIVNADRYGDESSGVAPNAATQRCDAIAARAGKPPTYKQMVGFGGVVCGQIWTFAAAAGHAPSLQRKSLADGLHAAKSIEMPYPRGPVDWSGPKATYGGQFWRLQTFQKACTCWKVTDATFRPGFG